MRKYNSARSVLLRAACRIESGGWCRGAMGDAEGEGPVCALAALQVSGSLSAVHDAEAVLGDSLRGSIVYWNDRQPNAATVIAKLREVAAGLL